MATMESRGGVHEASQNHLSEALTWPKSPATTSLSLRGIVEDQSQSESEQEKDQNSHVLMRKRG